MMPLDADDARRLVQSMREALCQVAHDYAELRQFTIALLIGCGVETKTAIAIVENLKSGTGGDSSRSVPNRHPIH